ncbi:hypothetical protein SAM23877_2662 [Streptomyces ambofaciens ATCC 23877]|uniref:Uncharacterized protein n=1 Tax=Streptomyces ambofaciens (strain ATCC 23877 / 3486 / DSM 40053 / JCM 4204 / NBRC 12836 / NRRL B-2516) TaxID=278992 RepID=A0A0K2AS16_STRA7|nr:hypothetical protein SAM23877_2662 [Streptomyces ambofaciens ATCC 23877]
MGVTSHLGAALAARPMPPHSVGARQGVARPGATGCRPRPPSPTLGYARAGGPPSPQAARLPATRGT